MPKIIMSCVFKYSLFCLLKKGILIESVLYRLFRGDRVSYRWMVVMVS